MATKEDVLQVIYWAGFACSACIWLFPAIYLRNPDMSPWLTIPFSILCAICLGSLSWAGVGLAISAILFNVAGM